MRMGGPKKDVRTGRRMFRTYGRTWVTRIGRARMGRAIADSETELRWLWKTKGWFVLKCMEIGVYLGRQDKRLMRGELHSRKGQA